MDIPDDLIEELFYKGYKRNETCAVLQRMGYSISTRTLNRLYRRLGLHGIGPSQRLSDAVKIEIEGSGSFLGCRMMQQRLLTQHKIKASRKDVMDILRELSPENVILRRQHKMRRRLYRTKGPNYLIHVDGFDKLKPYGFSVHGAIDGFSRKVLWLEIGRTNNNPLVVANYFMDYLKGIEGVPRCIQMDRGTENYLIEDIQLAFHMDITEDFCRSVVKSSSHHNQRIERWWRSLIEAGVGYWMEFFKQMVNTQLLDKENRLHLEIMRFCFMDILQEDLAKIKEDWNQHRVRLIHGTECPQGVPDILYSCSDLYGSMDYKYPVDVNDAILIQSLYCKKQSGCAEDVCEFLKSLLTLHNRNMAGDAQEAKDLYTWILSQI